MTSTTASTTPTTTPERRWRTRDIVVTAVIGVAFGVVFFLAGGIWNALAGLGPLQNVFYGVWLLPAIVAPLIVRKPGAAIFAEVVAASLSALLGSAWGVDTLVSGLLQGAGAEIVFAATGYRSYAFLTLALAGLAASAAAFIHDTIVWYAGYSTDVLVLIAIWMAISGALILPAVSLALVRALRSTGVLEGFPA